MAQGKWLKVGAAAFLSVGMLSACGDGDDENIEFEDPSLDIEDGEDKGDDSPPVVDENEDGVDIEPDPAEEDEVNTDKQLEEEVEEDRKDEGS